MTQIQFNEALYGLKNKLKYYALSLTAEEEQANDLIQETFFKALKYRKNFSHNSNFKGWVFTIMRNTFINEYRRKKKIQVTNKDVKVDYSIQQWDKISFPAPDIFYGITEIEKSIDALSDEYRIPLSMFLNGFKYQEIADKLKLPLGTVKSRIFFSRKILKRTLNEYIAN